MSADEVIKKVWGAYKNAGPSKVPSPSEDKYILALGRIDDAVQRIAKLPGVRLRSLYKEFSVTTSNGVASLPIDYLREVGELKINGKPAELVSLEDKIYKTSGVYLFGENPTKIALIDRTIPNVTITGSYIRTPDKVTQSNSRVECESLPYVWNYVAGQMATGDPAKEEMAPELFTQADVELQSLIQSYKVRPKGGPKNIPQRKGSVSLRNFTRGLR